jgi:CrcB protein
MPWHVVDPDVDLHDAAQRAESGRRRWTVLLACSLGGIVGAEARYAISTAVAHRADEFAWSTVIINASGCLLIGVLMAVLVELTTAPHHLLRPFLGVGVLGGYTTYSTFAVDVHQLLLAHRPLVALGYAAATLAACGLAVWGGTWATLRIGRAARESSTAGVEA